jgi:hypothetical protein
MQSLSELLASWATVLGTILTVIGLIQSRAWLTVVSVFFVCASIFAGMYARRQRLAIDSASVVIEGKSLDALNTANLRRRVNRSLVIQEACQVATIEGEDLHMTWRYSGYCHAEHETTFEFSVDSERYIPFSQLECFAYDLQHDRARTHKIRPFLIGPDGISKKIGVPFLNPLVAQQSFEIEFECDIPGCFRPGLGYYNSTLSFGQEKVPRCSVRLLFLGAKPRWVRIYQCDAFRLPTLLRELPPTRIQSGATEYLDVGEDLSARSARIYLFCRSSLTDLPVKPEHGCHIMVPLGSSHVGKAKRLENDAHQRFEAAVGDSPGPVVKMGGERRRSS